MAIHKKEIAFYKGFAENYDDRNLSLTAKLYYDYWDKLLLQDSPGKNKLKVLDLGCGTGDFLNKLKKNYPLAVGVDISEDMLNLAKKKYPKLKKDLIKSIAEKMPFKQNSFDLVFIRGALHHFQNPAKSLTEANRIIKKGGRLVLLEPVNDIYFLRFLRRLFFKIKPGKFLKDHKSFTKKKLERVIIKSGFKITSEKRLGFLAYPLCARPDVIPLTKLFPKKEALTADLIKLDEFLIKNIFMNKLSLLVVIYAQKK